MAKVAHIATVDDSIRLLLLNQLRSLQQAGHDVMAVSAAGVHVPFIEQAGIPHRAVPLTRRWSPWRDLGALMAIWRMVAREGITIVHTHTPKPGLIGQVAAKLAGVPIVVNTIHGFYFNDRTPFLKKRACIVLERLAARCSDLILFQSREDFETAAREGIGRGTRTVVLGNGIDLTRFDPRRVSARAVDAARRTLGIPDGRKVVGFVGRLVREKGLLDLLSAIRSLKDTTDLHLVAVGPVDGDKADAVTPEVCAQFGLQDRCTFTGMRSDMPELYALMDVFALPSYREGYPRALMEASAMGVPSVATDTRGCREVVTDGQNGLLVPVGDPPALASAIGRLLGSPDMRRAMRACAMRIAATTFDERAVFALVHEEYVRLLRQKKLMASAAA